MEFKSSLTSDTIIVQMGIRLLCRSGKNVDVRKIPRVGFFVGRVRGFYIRMTRMSASQGCLITWRSIVGLYRKNDSPKKKNRYVFHVEKRTDYLKTGEISFFHAVGIQ